MLTPNENNATVYTDEYTASVDDTIYVAEIDPNYTPVATYEDDNNVFIGSVVDDTYIASIGREGFPYEGSYHVTPTRETQTLATEGKYMLSDVIIDPIPQNYGLVERIGMSLRIS